MTGTMEGKVPSATCAEATAITMNVVPSILLLIANKALFVYTHWPCAALLIAFHLFANFIAMEMMRLARFFVSIEVPFRAVIVVMFPLFASDALQGLSMKLNSFGSFMVLKQLTIVFTAFGEMYYGGGGGGNGGNGGCGGGSLSFFGWVSILGLIFGAILVSVQDVTFNFLGLVVGVMASWMNAMGQIFLAHKLKDGSASALQFRYMSLWKGGWLIVISITIEFALSQSEIQEILQFDWLSSLPLLLMTCVLGPVVGLSHYFAIQATSALTYQVLAPLKLVLALVCSFFLFGEPISTVQMYGICVVIMSLGCFSMLK